MNSVLIKMSQDDGEYKLIVIVVILGVRYPREGCHLKAVKNKSRGTNTRGNVELGLRNIKCFDGIRKVMLLASAQIRTRRSNPGRE